MASFDLRYIQCAPYQATEGEVSYGAKVKVGDAMNADINFTFAEGRLYAEGKLSEYIKELTGGTISMGSERHPGRGTESHVRRGRKKPHHLGDPHQGASFIPQRTAQPMSGSPSTARTRWTALPNSPVCLS